MKFDYENNSKNMKRSVLIAPSAWEEFHKVKLSKYLNIINTKEIHHNNYFHMEGETLISELFSNNLTNKNYDVYEKAYKLILSDYRWVMLSERRWLNSSTFCIAKIRELVIGCCNYIEKNNLNFLFSAGVPHCIETWTLAMIIEKVYFGEVYIFEISAMPGYASLYKGIDKHIRINLDERFKTINTSKDKYAIDYIKASRGKSNTRDSNGLLTWLYDLDGLNKWKIKVASQIPKRIIQRIYSKLLFKRYKKFSHKGSEIVKDSVVYFMHYQPEATSLPIGQYFIEQSNAINTLRMAFPKNTKIYIKEHPTQYKQPIDPRFRPINYYQIISKIENVEFIDPMYPSYDLIDKAKFVSTLNGKVGFQSLLRGKPVICFGLASYRDHAGCHFYSNLKNLREFIISSDNIDFQALNNNFLDDLNNKCVSGFELIDNKLPTINNSIYEKARRVGLIKMIKSVFEIT